MYATPLCLPIFGAQTTVNPVGSWSRVPGQHNQGMCSSVTATKLCAMWQKQIRHCRHRCTLRWPWLHARFNAVLIWNLCKVLPNCIYTCRAMNRQTLMMQSSGKPLVQTEFPLRTTTTLSIPTCRNKVKTLARHSSVTNAVGFTCRP